MSHVLCIKFNKVSFNKAIWILAFKAKIRPLIGKLYLIMLGFLLGRK
jgi:hypothetical protein